MMRIRAITPPPMYIRPPRVGCRVNERGSRLVTASSNLDDDLRPRPAHLALPGFPDALERIGLDRKIALTLGGVGDELRIGDPAHLGRDDEVRVTEDLELLATNDARCKRRGGAGRLADLHDPRARGGGVERRDERLAPKRVDDHARPLFSEGPAKCLRRIGLVEAYHLVGARLPRGFESLRPATCGHDARGAA